MNTTKLAIKKIWNKCIHAHKKGLYHLLEMLYIFKVNTLHRPLTGGLAPQSMFLDWNFLRRSFGLFFCGH